MYQSLNLYDKYLKTTVTTQKQVNDLIQNRQEIPIDNTKM